MRTQHVDVTGWAPEQSTLSVGVEIPGSDGEDDESEEDLTFTVQVVKYGSFEIQAKSKAQAMKDAKEASDYDIDWESMEIEGVD